MIPLVTASEQGKAHSWNLAVLLLLLLLLLKCWFQTSHNIQFSQQIIHRGCSSKPLVKYINLYLNRCFVQLFRQLAQQVPILFVKVFTTLKNVLLFV
ncbi:hypothetical protein BDC45DRAFT_518708 [Circinella umbellata]|nr:hypothetical protein BDC45DRAFT_518708 [Circinella umbellata]